MVIKVFTQRNVCTGFGLASLLACTFALKIEKEFFQVELSYNISAISCLETLWPYRVLLLALSNQPKMHAVKDDKL